MINKVKLHIWDREFILPVIYDCYKNEEVTSEQIRAVEIFLILYNEGLIAKSKEQVVKYCHEDVKNDSSNEKKDNIFSYIKPESLYVKREEKNPRVALMCKYKYDLEHGLAIVFDYKGNIKIGLQDIII